MWFLSELGCGDYKGLIMIRRSKLQVNFGDGIRIGLDKSGGANKGSLPVMIYYDERGAHRSLFTGVFVSKEHWDTSEELPRKGCRMYEVWTARINQVVRNLRRSFEGKDKEEQDESFYKSLRCEFVLDTMVEPTADGYPVAIHWCKAAVKECIATDVYIRKEEWDAFVGAPRSVLEQAAELVGNLEERLLERLECAFPNRVVAFSQPGLTVGLEEALRDDKDRYSVVVSYQVDGKVYKRATGVFLSAADWDGAAGLPLESCPNFLVQKQIIEDQYKGFVKDIRA